MPHGIAGDHGLPAAARSTRSSPASARTRAVAGRIQFVDAETVLDGIMQGESLESVPGGGRVGRTR